jgi:hypothetical protein
MNGRAAASDGIELRSFYAGFAAALASLVRGHDQPSVAKDIMQSEGVTLKHLRSAGIDRDDLRVLTRAVKHG